MRKMTLFLLLATLGGISTFVEAKHRETETFRGGSLADHRDRARCRTGKTRRRLIQHRRDHRRDYRRHLRNRLHDRYHVVAPLGKP